jgi:hypothetical protein
MSMSSSLTPSRPDVERGHHERTGHRMACAMSVAPRRVRMARISSMAPSDLSSGSKVALKTA